MALNYQKLIYKCLEMVLETLKQSILSDIEKKFVEFYMAYAFFRIQQFKEQFVKEISDEAQITGNMDHESLQNLNWNKYFFQVLDKQELSGENKLIIKQCLVDDKWTNRILNSHNLFCSFLCEWCNLVEYHVNTKDIHWEEIDGYVSIKNYYIKLINTE